MKANAKTGKAFTKRRFFFSWILWFQAKILYLHISVNFGEDWLFWKKAKVSKKFVISFDKVYLVLELFHGSVPLNSKFPPQPPSSSSLLKFRLEWSFVFLKLPGSRRRGWWSYGTSGIKSTLRRDARSSFPFFALHCAECILGNLRLSFRVLKGHAPLTGIRTRTRSWFRYSQNPSMYGSKILVNVLRLNCRNWWCLVL